MEQEPKKGRSTLKYSFKHTFFYRWMLNNKVVTALAVILLVLLNVLLISHLGFIFRPISDFLSVISIPIIIAAVFYYLLNPIVDFFEKKKVSRLITIIVIFIILAGLTIWGLAFAIPNIAGAILRFSHHVPSYVDTATKEINNLLKDARFEQFRPQIDSVTKSIGDSLINWSKKASTSVVISLTKVISQTTSIIVSIVIFPFVLFYLLRDGNQFGSYISKFLPNAWREDTERILGQINSQIANFVRGQVAVAVIVTIMLLIGLPVIGLRYAVAIAILSGILNLVPFLGFFLSITPAIIIALATGGPIMAVKVLIVFFIEVTIESRFVSPLVLGSQLKIHPLTIIFILLTAEKIFGVFGMILAVPLYAAAKVIVTYIYQWYREVSELYDDEKAEVEDT